VQLCKINTNVLTDASSRIGYFRRKFGEIESSPVRSWRGRPTFSSVSADIPHTIVGVGDASDFHRAEPDRQTPKG